MTLLIRNQGGLDQPDLQELLQCTLQFITGINRSIIQAAMKAQV
jgi:hypothetical protein